MGTNNRSDESRRQFMEFLLASPLFSYVALPGMAFGPVLIGASKF